ncbi:ABC transporter permease [Streptomyces sp. HUAS MG47]|uniref:ABC transporter permease n=1 Tax=Streptomyces solicamelliae TaxID=3231716 RepID=UPI00387800D6
MAAMNLYVRSQLRHRRRRAFAVIGAVALGSALLIALTSLGAGFREAARAPLAGIAADLIVTRPDTGSASGQSGRGVRQPFGLATFDGAELGEVRSVQGVREASGSLQIWDFGPRSTVTIAGVDPAQRAVGPGRILDRNIVEGRALRPGERGVAVLDRHYAAFYGTKTGRQVKVGTRMLPVVGVVEIKDAAQTAAANVYLPLADAQQLAGLPADQVNQIHVQVGDSGETEEVTARINDRIGNVSAITADSLVQIMGAVGRISARFSTIAAVVGAIGGLILSWTALRGLVAERTREIGVLMALGWRRGDVVRAFRLEALVLGLAGAALGILVGLALAGLMSYVPIPELLPEPPGGAGHGGTATETGGEGLPVSISLTALAAATLLAVLGSTLAGILAAHRVTGLKPARNLVSL